jgi:hypothetical protein
LGWTTESPPRPTGAPSISTAVDPKTLKVRSRLAAPATADFGAASVAVEFDGAWWASSFQGDRIVQLK